MKRMLINATQPEELRVALVDGQKLYDLDIENRTRIQKKANVYKGRITRVEPSLEAAFVDFGAERHGFLPLKEISRNYFNRDGKSDGGRPRIKDVIKEGTEVIVQVEKEERGNKGAALTTFVSLAGRYMVLMPTNPRAGGISRRIEGEDRNQLREAMSGLNIPEGMGVIVRTAGIGRSTEELQWDLDYLLQLWSSISEAAEQRPAPFLIFQESNVVIRAIRDYLRQDIDQVLIDSPDAFNDAIQFVEQVMPQYKHKIREYNDDVPLFNRYQIESQIESAFQREVRLPSGGSVVIDPTEAMVSIDINSARSTRGSDIEDTAFQTNLEAADEIARQLRLRDIGGLIVIDFIDMMANKNQREVENRMRDALGPDRARVQVGRISRFGLLEMSRQRLRPSLGETSAKVCPRCNGQGTIRDTKSLALAILRLVEEEATKENSAEVRVIVPVDVATYLLNEKRGAISEIENREKVRVLVIASPSIETPHFEVQRLRDSEVGDSDETSYKVSREVEADSAEEPEMIADKPVQIEQAAVKAVRPSQPAPQPKQKTEDETKQAKRKPAQAAAQAEQEGLWSRVKKGLVTFFAGEELTPEPEPETKPQQRRRGNNQGNRQGQGQGQGQGQRRKQNQRRNNRGQQGGQNQGQGQQSNRDNAKNNKDDNKPRQRPNKRRDEEADNQNGNQSGDNKQGAQKRPANRRNRQPAERQRGEAPVAATTQQTEAKQQDTAQTQPAAENANANKQSERSNDKPQRPQRAKADQTESKEPLNKEPQNNEAPAKPTEERQVEQAANEGMTQAEPPRAEAKDEAKKDDAKPVAEAARQAEAPKAATEAAKPHAKAETATSEKAEKAPTKTERVETPKAPKPEVTRIIGRAANDPRELPKPVTEVEVTTGQPAISELNPELVAQPDPDRPVLPRAKNDPRNQQSA